jgi:hypothetical protein
MSDTDVGDFARSEALKIFNLSTSCLMAHSIRATELCLQNDGFPYTIKVQPRKNLAAKVGSRATAFIRTSAAHIFVDGDIELEQQRLAVAHELGHILIAMDRFKGTQKIERRADVLTEDACRLFESELCRRHDEFYANDSNIRAKCLFHSLHRHD